jgi:hypothetical protein
MVELVGWADWVGRRKKSRNFSGVRSPCIPNDDSLWLLLSQLRTRVSASAMP